MRVRAGKNGINRDYSNPTLPEWSWHPYEVVAFGDVVGPSSAFDPKRLESAVDWTKPGSWDETRVIGFNTLTVVRELGSSPLFLSIVSEGKHIELYWSNPGTNSTHFTVESTASIATANWEPVVGNWPAQTNHWSLDSTSVSNLFVRVRAE